MIMKKYFSTFNKENNLSIETDYYIIIKGANKTI
jgi:hypothetical protein